MHTLIIPACGKSSRFPDVRPKWLLTAPNGQCMAAYSVSELKLTAFDRVVLVVLSHHLKQYGVLLDQIKCQFPHNNLDIIVLEAATDNQPSTIMAGINEGNITGSICIKDCDNIFTVDCTPGNFIATANLSDFAEINPNNKSYVTYNRKGLVVNIVEKQIISNTFCTGLYGFDDAQTFKEFYNKANTQSNGELYISHIIWQMVLSHHSFMHRSCSGYTDFGTLEAWTKHKQQFATLFVDIDGVLVVNSAEYFQPQWGTTEALPNNVAFINKLYEDGKHHIVLTTARTLEFQQQTEAQLQKLGIKYHQILYGIGHSKRIIVNDFSSSNSYPSCISINLPRNSDTLQRLYNEQ